jgi:hypothetical protein
MQDRKQVRVQLLARYASPGDDHNVSIENQLRAVRAYAAKRGWPVVNVTVAVGVSGNSLNHEHVNGAK